MYEWLVWIVVIAILVIAVALILIYNALITGRNIINNSWAQIDVQLKRRTDLIPNLIESVKGYMRHERGVLTDVTKARTSLMNAKTIKAKSDASNFLTDALKSLFAVAENYPKLEASKNFLMLQEELSGTESKIAYARQFYNDSVMSFNIMLQAFPSSLVARAFGFEKRDYFQIEETERAPVKVKF